MPSVLEARSWVGLIFGKVVQELRCRLYSSHEEVISCTSAGYIQELPFGIVNILKITLVPDGLNPLLKGQHLVVAGHRDHRTELKTLGEMHCANGCVPARGLDPIIEHLEGQSSQPQRITGPVKLGW